MGERARGTERSHWWLNVPAERRVRHRSGFPNARLSAATLPAETQRITAFFTGSTRAPRPARWAAYMSTRRYLTWPVMPPERRMYT